MFILKENKPIEVAQLKSQVQNTTELNDQSHLQSKLEPLRIDTTNMENGIIPPKVSLNQLTHK